MSRHFPNTAMTMEATRTVVLAPAFSFAFWIYLNNPAGGPGQAFCYPLFSDSTFFMLFYNAVSGFGPNFDGLAELAWEDSNLIPHGTDSNPGVVPDNTWFHFVGTINFAGDKKFHLYKDGVELAKTFDDVGTGTGLSFVPHLPPSGPPPYPPGWSVGADPRDGYACDAYVEDVRLWSVALTLAEIQQVFQGQSVRASDLIGWWKLCGESSPEPDSSANNNPMILSSPEPLVGPHAPQNVCISESDHQHSADASVLVSPSTEPIEVSMEVNTVVARTTFAT